MSAPTYLLLGLLLLTGLRWISAWAAGSTVIAHAMTAPVRLTAPRRPAPVPARHPRIAHFMPYLLGDAANAPRRAKRLGFRFIDMNGNSDRAGVTWMIHYDEFRKQFRWYWTGKTDAKGREVRARVPDSWPKYLHQLSTDQARSLRSARTGGRKPITAKGAMVRCAGVGIVLCLEVKNSPQYLTEAAWGWLEAAAIETGCVVVVMTLQNLYRKGSPGDPWMRLHLAATRGFAVAILARMAQPKGWPTFHTRDGVQLWGKWRPRKAPATEPGTVASTAAMVVTLAKTQVGYREGRDASGWNNQQKYSDEVPGLEWSNGQPWCATFESWLDTKAGLRPNVDFPVTASCDAAWAWFKNHGRLSEYPAIGAWALYGVPGDLRHTGRVVAFDDTWIYTIEGNTNTTGASQGDGVYELKRRRRDDWVRGYGYPAFPEGIKSADPAWAGRK